MRWIRPLSAQVDETAEVVGGKAHGLLVLRRLGLPVPPGFVITTEACRAFLRDGRFPDGLDDELAAAMAALNAPAVSVRSGASVSMPGMMNTILNLDRDVDHAVATVFSSWNTPRAQTYRELHDIPHDLGTAVIVQAMVFGNLDEHSGTGVAFSRDPNTGANTPFGEVLFGHRGDAVVSGGALTEPLSHLDREPLVHNGLLDALRHIEGHYLDACYVEFTFEAGELWLLQVRPGRFVGAAAVRVATDLADEGVIDRREALLRVSPQHLRHVRTPRMVADHVLARGLGACPGVTSGRVATTTDSAVRMSVDGPVVLVRPETSPHDMRGLAAATGIVITARGGPASHAAVVARAMGKPAVVGIADLVVGAGEMSVGGHTVDEGTLVTIDGTSGEVALGRQRVVTTAADGHLRRLLEWADDVSGDRTERDEAERLSAAHSVLRKN
ncbi:PEP/pyruvate-binding domain-containing protein [Lentzea sp. BCCO 10_0856]|uniref:PEP/pyruvate-binding domain-containing protein n=1 Tax=Lentzea miocenica TaxID=3095431 RepID=A0ABU4TAW7_9PSEU|nr:PEP/pyruvate-binding domain-containing protein [Lentzea sp. BCCO 10_0856]MDX8035308.1 PEP/pyruvate-binding domain-containing protein [Lentzea sp. BCCO 10_0856]